MNSQPLVAVIIVSFNQPDDILRCLASLRCLNYSNYKVIVIDNGSQVDMGDLLAQSALDLDLIFIPCRTNLGFAAACNIGIQSARKLQASWYWLLNPDTEVDAASLCALIEAADREPGVGAFGSKIYYGQAISECSPASELGKSIIWGAGGKIDLSSQLVCMIGSGELDRGQYDSPADCDYLPGCSLLLSAETVNKAGLMPEKYFMYFEETDWCWRMKTAGMKLFYVPQSVVWHYFDNSKMQQPFAVYYYNRNQRYFWLQFLPWRKKLKLIAKTIFSELPRIWYALRQAKEGNEKEVFKAHLQAALDFLLGRMGKRR